ncbi:type II toxin-antitoxin system PemK/MazF family toxin [Lactobacillus sp. PFC-70]|nr:type II toxin-antitoxin system PemK/MazF family toxin [Lactobacillus sp. PFC-70]
MVDIPKNGDIIYIDFDPSARVEIQKRRPAVVVSNNQLMMTSPFVWVVPISHGKFNGQDYPLHVSLDKRTKIDGTVYTEQLKSFDDVQRDWQFVERLPKDLKEEIQNKIRLVIQLDNH